MKKYQGIIMTLFGMAAVLGGLVLLSNWQAGSEKQSAQAGNLIAANGMISATETSFDFGNVSMAAGKVSHIFTLKNTGTEPATITKVYTSCMCTAANIIKGNERFGPFGMPGMGYVPPVDETLAPNEEVQVEAVFDPAAHGPAGLGQIERVITIENNSKINKVELSFAANVTP